MKGGRPKADQQLSREEIGLVANMWQAADAETKQKTENILRCSAAECAKNIADDISANVFSLVDECKMQIYVSRHETQQHNAQSERK